MLRVSLVLHIGLLSLEALSQGMVTRTLPYQGSRWVKKAEISAGARSPVISQEESFSAVVIKADEPLATPVEISVNGKIYEVPRDPDAPSFTYFISLPVRGHAVEIKTDIPVPYRVFTISSGESPAISPAYRDQQPADCPPAFTAILQSEWRAGLPEPDYSRSFHSVNHVVVHHAAGSNSNTDYTQVVRDIYLLHTQVNGWSDIGYNYLVAQDGSIYTGRDPGSGAQDNVMGAHFCAHNSGTMGVCLLGNYESAQPTSATLGSLNSIIAFKLHKEGLEPGDTHLHALGEFEAVIGHRDGCSTACPGENVYQKLNDIRAGVQATLDECDGNTGYVLNFSASDQIIEAGNTVTFTNLSRGYEAYKWSFENGSPATEIWEEQGDVTYVVPGLFAVTLVGMARDRSDTLLREKYVEVQAREPVIGPNPARSLSVLYVNDHRELGNVQLFAVSGSRYQLARLAPGKYRLPHLSPGIYFVRVRINGIFYQQKLIVL